MQTLQIALREPRMHEADGEPGASAMKCSSAGQSLDIASPGRIVIEALLAARVRVSPSR